MAEPLDSENFDDEHVPYDAGEPKTVNAARKKAARLRRKRTDFVRGMMDTHEGRMWAYDYLSMGHIAEPTHTPGDPYSTAFREGERNLANKMLSDISESAPEKYMVMMAEGRDEK